jgi:hypothetical protein
MGHGNFDCGLRNAECGLLSWYRIAFIACVAPSLPRPFAPSLPGTFSDFQVRIVLATDSCLVPAVQVM